MKINQFAIIFGVLLAFSQASAYLECYVCENCDKITKMTPVETCNASYFDSAATTPSTIFTTSTTVMADDTTRVTETVPVTFFTASDTTSTTVVVKDAQPPTPPTVSTTPIPTPPTSAPLATDAFVVTESNLTIPPVSMLTNRRRRAATDSEYTYHCYRIQNQVDGVNVTTRGCTRVTTMQSACGTLQQADNITSKCYPCSTSLCNGSSAIGVSAIAVILAVFASLLRSQ